MPLITIVERSGAERQVSVQTGLTLMENLRDVGVDDILALCGGACACATCHVYLDEQTAARQGPVGRDEDDLLDTSEHRTPLSRLSCQLEVTEGWEGAKIQVAPAD